MEELTSQEEVVQQDLPAKSSFGGFQARLGGRRPRTDMWILQEELENSAGEMNVWTSCRTPNKKQKIDDIAFKIELIQLLSRCTGDKLLPALSPISHINSL